MPIDIMAARAALEKLYDALEQAKRSDDDLASQIETVRGQALSRADGLGALLVALTSRVSRLETQTPAPATRIKLGSPFYLRYDTVDDKAKWAALIAKGPSNVGLIVFNPSTGVGSTASASYQAAVAAARAAGIPIVVYVPTNYLDLFGYSTGAGTVAADGVPRGPNQVQNILDEISRARQFYGAAVGVFLDEINNKPLPEVMTAYGKVRDHIRTLFGAGSLVVQNPGTSMPESMMPLADVFMRFESDATKYSGWTAPDWHAKYPGRFWDCVHHADPAKLNEYVAAAKRNRPGLVWITDDSDSNVYNSNPIFLDALCTALA